MKAARLEKFLHILLPYFLVVSWLAALAGALILYKEHHAGTIADWLINYHGGFVRRGLTGEIAIGLASLTSLNMGNVGSIIVALQLLCYGIYFTFSYLLLRSMYLLPYAMLIISPFIFTFQVNEFWAGCRKEIIYFAVLSFLAWSKCSLRRDMFEKIFFTVLPLYSLVVLSHEMLILFLPYLLILYIIGSNLSRKEYCLLAVCSIPALISFMLCLHFKGTPDQVNAIFDILEKMNYPIDRTVEGAVNWLDHSTQNGIARVYRVLGEYVGSYLVATALSLAAFLPIHNTLHALFNKKIVTVLFSLSLAATLILAIVAVDWGRFLYIHLVSLFMLALVVDKITQQQDQLVRAPTVPAFTLSLVVIWALTWHIPHCFPGSDGENVTIQNIKEMNYLRIVIKRL